MGYSMAIAAANGQTMPPNLIKKGPKAPPHRPGALPMPPGMDIRRMLDDTAHSSSLNDSSKRKSSILNLPMPDVSGDDDSLGGGKSGGSGKKKRKPKVIGKSPPTKMS